MSILPTRHRTAPPAYQPPRRLRTPAAADSRTVLAGAEIGAQVAAARALLGALAIDTAARAALEAGLSVHAGRTARADAIVAWSDVAADAEAAAPGQDAGSYHETRDILRLVLRGGLLPGVAAAAREQAGEDLIDAAAAIARLVEHDRAGTTAPDLRYRGGLPAAAVAMATELAEWQEMRLHMAVHLADRWDGSTR